MSRGLLAGLSSASTSASSGPMAQFHALTQWLAQSLDMLQAGMAANWLLFGGIQLVVAGSGVLPAAAVAMIAGASFGIWGGIAISASTTMLGGWLSFVLSRSVLRPWIERWIGRSEKRLRLDAALGQESWRFVLLLRVSPIMPFAPTSYALGLSSICQRSYLLGTLASLPALIGYVALGALGRQSFAMAGGSMDMLRMCLLAAGFLLVALAMMRVRSVLGDLAKA